MSKTDHAARLRLRMILTAKCSQKERLVMILRELAASSDAQELAKEILAEVENATSRKGRPPQTIAEFERKNRFCLDVAVLKRKNNLSTAEALRQIQTNSLSPTNLRKEYYRYKRVWEKLAKLL